MTTDGACPCIDAEARPRSGNLGGQGAGGETIKQKPVGCCELVAVRTTTDVGTASSSDASGGQPDSTRPRRLGGYLELNVQFPQDLRTVGASSSSMRFANSSKGGFYRARRRHQAPRGQLTRRATTAVKPSQDGKLIFAGARRSAYTGRPLRGRPGLVVVNFATERVRGRAQGQLKDGRAKSASGGNKVFECFKLVQQQIERGYAGRSAAGPPVVAPVQASASRPRSSGDRARRVSAARGASSIYFAPPSVRGTRRSRLIWARGRASPARARAVLLDLLSKRTNDMRDYCIAFALGRMGSSDAASKLGRIFADRSTPPIRRIATLALRRSRPDAPRVRGSPRAVAPGASSRTWAADRGLREASIPRGVEARAFAVVGRFTREYTRSCAPPSWRSSRRWSSTRLLGRRCVTSSGGGYRATRGSSDSSRGASRSARQVRLELGLPVSEPVGPAPAIITAGVRAGICAACACLAMRRAGES